MAPVYDPNVAPVSLSRPMMRLLANTVLLISDLDVLFTLFTFGSYFNQGKWYVPLVLFIFACIYSLGCRKAVQYSESQRALKLFEFVNKKLAEGSEEGLVRNYAKESITGHNPELKFDTDLEVMNAATKTESSFRRWSDKERQGAMRGVLALKQLQKDFTSLQNSNTMKYEHSIPLYRLAAFGWQGDLEPMDLSGILNANALYSFTVGTPQLIFSLWTLFGTDSDSSADTAILFISAVIGAASFFISLVNILADFTKKLKELLRKEKHLEARKQSAQPRIDTLKEFLGAQLDQEFEAKKDDLFQDVKGDGCLKNGSKLAKWAELYENKKKVIFQSLDAMYRTEQITDLLPQDRSPFTADVADKVDTVKATVWMIIAWVMSFVLLHANIYVHSHLLVLAGQQEVEDPRFFYAGLSIFILVIVCKIAFAYMFALGTFETKPTFLSLTENLALLLPVATSIVFVGAGDHEKPVDLEVAGIVIAILEVGISTYMNSVPPRTLQTLLACCRKGGTMQLKAMDSAV